MSSPGNYAKGYVRWTAGGKRVMWDGSRWQQLCQIEKCLKRDQKSQGVCLIHFREQQQNLVQNGRKKSKLNSPIEKKASKTKQQSSSRRSKRIKSDNSSKAISDSEQLTSDINNSDMESIDKQNSLSNGRKSKSRRSPKKFTLVCSSLTRQQLTRVELFCKRFSGRISSQIDSSTTHLIASEVESRVCCLTKKVFFAVAYHHLVVGYQWIEDCLEKQTLISEENYEIFGDASLANEHNGMQRSRLTRQPIFMNYPCAIAVECAIGCQHGMFNRQELEQLVELCGAHLVKNIDDEQIDSNRMIIVLCDDNDKAIARKYQTVKNKVFFVIPEFFLDSIVLYEIQPIKFYELVFQPDK